MSVRFGLEEGGKSCLETPLGWALERTCRQEVTQFLCRGQELGAGLCTRENTLLVWFMQCMQVAVAALYSEEARGIGETLDECMDDRMDERMDRMHRSCYRLAQPCDVMALAVTG